ncbi:MAG: hypothetical protein RDU83_00205 [bacterium]|nr:hypothetical protein [bacterium]
MEQPDWDTATWQLLADLEVDAVLALSQVRRRYVPTAREKEIDLWLRVLRRRGAINLRRVWVPRTARARLAEEIVVIEPPGASIRQEEMAHRLGLAEMRWRLRDGLRRWEVVAQAWPEKRTHGERPDAMAEDAAGLIAVEYDHGAYGAADVVRKQRAFAALTPRQVWGTSSEPRRRWLHRHLRGQNIMVVVW